MNINKIIGIIVAVLIVGGGVVFALANNSDSSNNTQQSGQTGRSEMNMASGNQSEASESSDEPMQTNMVFMKNIDFTPEKITVKKGTTVTWTNQDDVQHNVAPDNPTEEFKKSELFGKGGTYSVTFNTVGSYSYNCTPHPFMKGTVVVTE